MNSAEIATASNGEYFIGLSPKFRPVRHTKDTLGKILKHTLSVFRAGNRFILDALSKTKNFEGCCSSTDCSSIDSTTITKLVKNRSKGRANRGDLVVLGR
ncbi:hypothetical protein OH492_24685 [Vibrio chagasii]|nr:hypothetical protein [Vibrio chagasii]